MNTDLNKHYQNEQASLSVIRDFMQDAIDRRGTVWLKYRAENGEITERDFEPHEVQVTRSSIRIIGMCKLRNESRTLLSKGILEISRTKPNPTYVMGQIVQVRSRSRRLDCIVAQTGPREFQLISLDSGNRMSDKRVRANGLAISQEQIDQMSEDRDPD